MAKPENDENYQEKQTWNTWEELLLACAVHRHGIDSWDTVAVEIQKQNSSFRTLTALDCRNKYHDLKRRFSMKEETVSEISSVPWLEELRKLRVDELRREVQRYDLSISSLQLKVKRLEDERDKSFKETQTETETETSDLRDNHVEPGNYNSDVPVTEPDPKYDNSPGAGSENTTGDREIVKPVEEKPNRIEGDDTDEKPAREDSGKGSCESVAKESDRGDPVREGNDSPESMCESKETSDVQSSASLPRKDTIQPDNEDQSLTVHKTPVESRPLIDFIEILQSHPIGSHFSRRLQKLQETTEYERTIRQHIDFELIRTRVDKGYYESSKSQYFRDLLLLINNARVFFFDERSSDLNSAKELYELIRKQMTLKMSKQTSPPKEEFLVTSKEEVTVSSPPLSLKPKMSVSIKACRRRSSLAVRSSEPFKKNTKIVPTTDEKKPVSEAEEEDETSDKDEEPIVSKKMPRGRSTSAAKKVGSRNVRTTLDDGLPSKGRSSNDSSEQKKSDQEKKGNNTNSGSKKQSAASFLKRMKGASSSETVLETVKADSSSGKRGAEQRKSNSKHEKVDAGKPSAGQKRATVKKPTIEKGSPTKKNTSAASKREVSEKEEGSSTRPKKRTRRL